MNSKEIKARLKDAREAIRLKDFKTAEEHCKAVLEKETSNYNALVFLGVACEGLNKIQDALNAYRTATQQTPDQLLAWQGIASLLDKDPDGMGMKEKIGIYHKLQTLVTGPDCKRLSYLHKLVDLYQEDGSVDKAYETVMELLELETEGDGRKDACKQLVGLLQSCHLSKDDTKSNMFHECLKELLQSMSLSLDEANIYTRLWLYSTTNASIDTHNLSWKNLQTTFSQAVPPVEYGLQTVLESTIGVVKVEPNVLTEIDSLSKQLEKLDGDSEILKTANGVVLCLDGQYGTAKESLSGITEIGVTSLYYLAQVHLKLKQLDHCMDACIKGLFKCSLPGGVLTEDCEKVQDVFKLIQAQAHRLLATEVDRSKCLDLLTQIEERIGLAAVILKAYLHLDSGNIEEAQCCLQALSVEDHIEVKMLKASVAMACQQYNNALDLVEEILKSDPNHAMATLTKGVALWELRKSPGIDNANQQCFTSLLKAAKLDPQNYESFVYLGRFYEHIQNDLSKALRCYRKSYDLNPSNDDAGCCYVDALLDQGEQDQALVVLKTVTGKAPAGKAKWAWLRLGLHQIKFGDPSLAITCLQAALRADPKDNHVWECLSEAYLHRGSLTAALKAFTKATELNPGSVYCLYQIASIKQTLGQLSEAVQEYHCVLEQDPNYVAALKGLGETLLQLGRQHLSQCLDGLAQDCLEEAISVLARGASLRPDFSCLWKLLGDGCTMVSNLASDSYRIPSKLVNKDIGQQVSVEVTKEQLLDIGGRCYSQSVKIMPENGSLWHSLSINLYHQATHKLLQPTEEKHHNDAREVLERSRKAMDNALRLEPDNWRHWNGMGILACFKVDPKLALAQHCFIKSIQCEANNVLAWSNLGVLYLSQGNIKLAHDAFKVAQRLDPTFMVGWLGQALIAETVGHEEALDLFRHTTELGAHLESEIGYGHQVLTLLADKASQGTELFHYCIQKMAAVPAASDALIKYTARVQTDPVAYNMLGLLLEHQNLPRPAAEAFFKALSLLEAGTDKEKETRVRMNYARVLCTQGLYRQSMDQFELIQSDLTLHNLMVYALAAYKDDSYLDSFKLYKLALEQAESHEGLKSEVHAAIAMVAFKAGDMEEVKTQLFQGFQTECPSLQGLLAMCALGLQQRDITLTTAALDELVKRSDGVEVMEKIATVILHKHVLEGTTEEGEVFVRELVESYPQCGRKLQQVLAAFLLNGGSGRSEDVLKCVDGVQQEHGNLNMRESVLQTVGQLQAGVHKRHNTHCNAFKSAQRMFHQYPGELSSQTAFVSALHAEGVLRKPSNRHIPLFKAEKAQLDLIIQGDQGTGSVWYIQQLVVCCVELGLEQEARQLLDMLKELESNSHFIEALSRMLYATPIDEWTKLDNFLAIQIVCNVMIEEESGKTAINDILKIILTQLSDQHENVLSKSKLVELWTHIAFRGIQKKAKGLNELRDLFKEGVCAATKWEASSALMSIMQGIQALKGEKKEAKRYLATALDQSSGKQEVDSIQSVARQGLISLLADSTKPSDQQLIEALVKDADTELDQDTLTLYGKCKQK